MNKNINKLVLIALMASISAGYANVKKQDAMSESAYMGTEMASKTFDKVETIIKVLPKAKEDTLRFVKNTMETVEKVFQNQEKRDQLEAFLSELSALENPDDQAVNDLLEKYPVGKEVQSSGVVEAFIAGIALVLSERCGLSDQDALMIARVIFPLFLPKN